MNINFIDLQTHLRAYLSDRGHAIGGVMHQEMNRFLDFAAGKIREDAAAVESAINLLAKKGYTVAKNEVGAVAAALGDRVGQNAVSLVKAAGDKAESSLKAYANDVIEKTAGSFGLAIDQLDQYPIRAAGLAEPSSVQVEDPVHVGNEPAV